jgi:hypothetical protein
VLCLQLCFHKLDKFESLFTFIGKLKAIIMYHVTRLKGLLTVQNRVFEGLEKFITYYNTQGDKGGYLLFIEKADCAITIQVGAERFTINSQIYLKERKVIFKIYARIFDMSNPERYNFDHVPDLDFYSDDEETVKYFTSKTSDHGNGSQYTLIMSFNHFHYEQYLEPFYSELEKYTDKRLESA